MGGGGGNDNLGDILDAIAFIHLVRLPAVDRERMKSALGRLERVVSLSRSCWRFILAETDDDREWIPNPKQASIAPNARVTEEMVKGWGDFLDEIEAILAGRKLAPFWRSAGAGRGINVRRVFLEPREFDLALWVQGVGAAPYLEEGELSKPETWSRLNRIFGGEFLGFAIWFN